MHPLLEYLIAFELYIQHYDLCFLNMLSSLLFPKIKEQSSRCLTLRGCVFKV